MSIVLIKKQCLRLLAPRTFARFATLRQLGYTSVNFLQISNVCRFQASLSNFRKILKNFYKKFACILLRLHPL